MTDRVHSLTAALGEDIRTDDVQKLIDAIRLLRGVVHVATNVVDPSDFVARIRANRRVYEAMGKLTDGIERED